MAWLQTLHHIFNSSKVERVACSIAAENHHRVLERITEQGVGMIGGEAKGYIRARAALVVGSAVDKYMTAERVASDRVRNVLVEQTTRVLVVNLIPELVHRASVRAARRAA